MLNWRRDPDYERRMNALAIRIQQIEKETAQIESDISRVRKETAQIEKETALLKEQNARGRELLASIDALCLEDDSSSTPAPSTPAATALFSL
jgi:predicted  nucleic acid-binding Zn-ribbon protein